MADEANATAKVTKVKMPRAVHELRTGPKPEQMIASGTIIDDELAKKHKLGSDELKALEKSGAVELVEVLKG